VAKVSEFTYAQVEAEKARLRIQYGVKNWYAKAELAWAWATNREHYRLTTEAWKELGA